MKTHSLLELFKDTNLDSFAPHRLMLDYVASLATIEDDQLHKRLLEELIHKYVLLEKRVDSLLKNTLPEAVAEEIKYEGKFSPRSYDCTILFSDFVGFTRLAERISGDILINTLDQIFTQFDRIVNQHKGTKIKTIGDAYMAVFGAPTQLDDHAVRCVRTAMALIACLDTFNKENALQFQMRIGVHSGKVRAGVVGKERMQFDVFGDDVNIASRFESSGEKGRVNVSENTYLQSRAYFQFEERGWIDLKNKGRMKAYFVTRERQMEYG
ncbi:MAG: adenylate/guanylate cyclase domain-containing protein [Deltaproteobacteria bacterium]|nr:adenylate/guanylate cyclase domain-containing protein [Deltaproteobacteria bacterium]